MNDTERIQSARAVIEIIRKRLTFVGGGLGGHLTETNVVDGLTVIPKEMQKTFFAVADAPGTSHLGRGDEKYKWVQVIDGKPVQAFYEEDLLVID